MRIFKEFNFEAAHHLPAVPDDHKCKRLHGHHYRVRLEFYGEIDPVLGWVCDFGTVEEAARDLIISKLDHRLLNSVDGLENPTAEHIALWILDRFAHTELPIKSVTVFETPDCGAVAEQP